MEDPGIVSAYGQAWGYKVERVSGSRSRTCAALPPPHLFKYLEILFNNHNNLSLNASRKSSLEKVRLVMAQVSLFTVRSEHSL